MRTTALAASAALALSAAALGATPALATGSAPSSSCADYPDQGYAQVAFDADPQGLSELDPDGNGVACEDLALLISEGQPELPSDEDVDCDFFPSWRVAQASYEDVLDRLGEDRYTLDADDDGTACEDFDYGAGKSYDDTTGDGSMTMPVGGVDAGGGGAAGPSTAAGLATGGALAAAGTAGLVITRRRVLTR